MNDNKLKYIAHLLKRAVEPAPKGELISLSALVRFLDSHYVLADCDSFDHFGRRIVAAHVLEGMDELERKGLVINATQDNHWMRI